MEAVKYILELIRNILTVSKELEETRKDVKELRQTVDRLTLLVQTLADQIVMNHQRGSDALEKHKLEVDVKILKFDNYLKGIPKSGIEINASRYLASSVSNDDSSEAK